MSKKALIVLAVVVALLLGGVVAGGGALRRQFIAMHGGGSQKIDTGAHAERATAHVARAVVQHATALTADGSTRTAKATDSSAAVATQHPVPGARPPAPGSTPSAKATDNSADSESPADILEKRAHGWVAAFSAGETAMRDFLAGNFAGEALAARPVEARMEGYRKLRQRFGSLTVADRIDSRPGVLELNLIAADDTGHEFIFTAQNEEPFKLVSVAYREVQAGHGH